MMTFVVEKHCNFYKIIIFSTALLFFMCNIILFRFRVQIKQSVLRKFTIHRNWVTLNIYSKYSTTRNANNIPLYYANSFCFDKKNIRWLRTSNESRLVFLFYFYMGGKLYIYTHVYYNKRKSPPLT